MKIQGIDPKPKINTITTLQTSPEESAIAELKRLGFESENVLLSKEANKSIQDFYNVLRRQIESLNIFVFQDSMSIQEVRGLTLSEKFPRVIVINSKDKIQAKIFSLLHEYGHVLLRKDGMCIPQAFFDQNNNDTVQVVEAWCNRFAAEVLMPKKKFLAEYNRLEKKEGKDIKKIVDSLSRKFKASKQATIIRVKTLTENDSLSYRYRRILDELKNKSTESTKKSHRSL